MSCFLVQHSKLKVLKMFSISYSDLGMKTSDCDVIHKELVDDTQNKMKSEEDYLKLAGLFKMFDDKTRVKILHALEQNEMCVCDLAVLLGVTKSAVSHQLKALRLANLVKYRREAQIVYYSLADEHVKEILDIGFNHLYE